jgi:dephospho-CoA kinase
MDNPKPLLIGLTGGIGCGKSTVAKIFSILGIPIYSADDRAKFLMVHHQPLKHSIIQHFGEQAYTKEGQLNREYLAAEVFKDQNKVAWLNQKVHPEVHRDFENWANHQNTPYVIKEAALLFETGSFEHLDKIITVFSPVDLRVHRIKMRDPHRTEEQIQHIIAQQLPDEVKNEKADFLIKNDEDQLIIPQVLKVHQQLLALSNEVRSSN